MSSAPFVLALAVLALVAAGCQSTQSKSAELAANGGASSKETGLRIVKRNPDVRVGGAIVLSDRNGTAAVVELRNTGKRTLVDVPIAIDVRKGGKSVFRNDAPGLEPSLAGVAALAPGQSVAWVNDQVLVDGPKVDAKVGTTSEPAPAKLPAVDLSPPKVGGDPTSGIAIEGKATNRSGILQRKLVIYAVARRGGKIVAAGRGQIERLKPGKSSSYQIFFIGNPKGAKVQLVAPPTTFH